MPNVRPSGSGSPKARRSGDGPNHLRRLHFHRAARGRHRTADRRRVPEAPAARLEDHPGALERAVRVDPDGRPRRRDRPRERDQLSGRWRAAAVPRRRQRDRAALPVRPHVLREQGGSARRQPLRHDRRGRRATTGARRARALARRPGHRLPRDMTLYRPEAFDSLTDTPWDESAVRGRIREIVADADASFRGPKLMWRAHEWDRWNATSPMKNLYVGGSGVLWGLDQLRRRGYAETKLDLADLATRSLVLFRAKPDYVKLAAFKPPEPRDSSLFVGEAGILLVTWRLAPSDVVADDLFARVRANVDNEAEEIFWGVPGSLIAARAMREWTGDARWHEATHELAEALLARLGEDGLWTQRLYGQEYQSLTPPHGLVGNVQALAPLLDERRANELKRNSAAVLAASVHREDGLANWPPR